MSTTTRFGLGIYWTVGLMFGGLLYNEVFVLYLYPMVDTSEGSTFGTPIVWLEQLVPVVLIILLLGVWIWVVAGAVQSEQTVNRRVRR